MARYVLRPTRLLVLAVLGLFAVGPLVACGSDNDGSVAPVLADATATGRELATKFISILQEGDRAQLDAFLDDAFQIQRADGSGATKSEYLDNPAKVSSFELGPTVIAVQHGNVLTVRWSLMVDEIINGQKAGKGEAPRLSTFVWEGGDWHLLAHANFNTADR